MFKEIIIKMHGLIPDNGCQIKRCYMHYKSLTDKYQILLFSFIYVASVHVFISTSLRTRSRPPCTYHPHQMVLWKPTPIRWCYGNPSPSDGAMGIDLCDHPIPIKWFYCNLTPSDGAMVIDLCDHKYTRILYIYVSFL